MLPAITCSKPTIRPAAPGDQFDADLAAVQRECQTSWSEDRIIEMLAAIRDTQRGEKRALQEARAALAKAEERLTESSDRLKAASAELKAERSARTALEREIAALRQVNELITDQLASQGRALEVFTNAQSRPAVANEEPIYVDNNTRWG